MVEHKKIKINKTNATRNILVNDMIDIPNEIMVGYGLKTHTPTNKSQDELIGLIIDTENPKHFKTCMGNSAISGVIDYLKLLYKSYIDDIIDSGNSLTLITSSQYNISNGKTKTCIKSLYYNKFKFKKVSLKNTNIATLKDMYDLMYDSIEDSKSHNAFGFIILKDSVDMYKYCIIVIRYDNRNDCISSWAYNGRYKYIGSMPTFVREIVSMILHGVPRL